MKDHEIPSDSMAKRNVSFCTEQQDRLPRTVGRFAHTHTPSMDLGPVTAGDHITSRLVLHAAAVHYVENAKIPGDIVETGVYVGKSAEAMAKTLVEVQDRTRKVWLYDSWEGMPKPTEVDGERAKGFIGWGKDATMEGVRERLRAVGFDTETQAVFRKGWFNTTFQLEKPSTIAILHADCDWYDSVLLTLETFYDRVMLGGVVIFDDYGIWPGARVAFYRFFNSRGEYPLLERTGPSVAWFIKGKEQNHG